MAGHSITVLDIQFNMMLCTWFWILSSLLPFMEQSIVVTLRYSKVGMV